MHRQTYKLLSHDKYNDIVISICPEETFCVELYVTYRLELRGERGRKGLQTDAIFDQ
jgi:hypothetical protein